MRIQIIAERELRAAARRKATYWVRWLTAVGFFAVFIWLLWAMDALSSNRGAHDVFTVFSVMVFFYCLIIGAVQTADCISGERREGTLGLLFLTNLNSLEIITGKLLSNALPAIYGLVAIFPIMGMPLLMGGVTFPEFLRVLLALLAAIGFSLGCGILSSVLCRRHFAAVAMAMGMVISLGTITFLGAALAKELKATNFMVQTLASLSPLYLVSAAFEPRIFGENHFWRALGNIAGISVLMLGCATWILSWSWRDRTGGRPRLLSPNPATGSVRPQSVVARRVTLRKRLLDANPFYWLAARKQRGATVFTVVLLAVVLCTVTGTTPLFAKLPAPAGVSQALGEMLAWLCAAALLHLLTLYYAAMLGAQAFAEDKQSSALELIFSTPATVPQMLHGSRMAFLRRMLLPALVVSLAHALALWKIMAVVLLEPPGSINMAGATQWDALFASLFNLPINGRRLEWEFVLSMRVIALILPCMVAMWFTVAQTGRWLGLRMRHPGFAPLLAIALIVLPSTLVVSVTFYLADAWNLYRYNDRIVAPAMAATVFLIVLGICAVVAGWAGHNLRENFRTTVIGRFDRTRRSWSRLGWTVLRLTLKGAAAVLLIYLCFVGHYLWKNHSSKRAWKTFQAGLKSSNISLDPASAMPLPVAPADNFAGTQVYTNLFRATNTPLGQLLTRMPDLGLVLSEWESQTALPLAHMGSAIGMTGAPGSMTPKPGPQRYVATPLGRTLPPAAGSTNNLEFVTPLMIHLDPYHNELKTVGEAARRPAFRESAAIYPQSLLNPPRNDIVTLRKLHLLFTVRALAQIHRQEADAALEDVLTGLRLARLTGQSCNIEGSSFAQQMMLSSLQPVWEGLDRQQWNQPQLASLASELARLNPTADFTNAVNLAVRAHIALWRTFPTHPEQAWQMPAQQGWTQRSHWRGMHRNWWYECAMDLYQVGEDAILLATPDSSAAPKDLPWGTVWELPLTEPASALFQRVMVHWQEQVAGISLGVTRLNQARTAVALEQFRLAQGSQATSLDQLVPTYLPRLPHDALTREPLFYELNTNGIPRLWSAGVNRINDRTNTASDDWVWTYPTNGAGQVPAQ